jgi:hypothetical protein
VIEWLNFYLNTNNILYFALIKEHPIIFFSSRIGARTCALLPRSARLKSGEESGALISWPTLCVVTGTLVATVSTTGPVPHPDKIGSRHPSSAQAEGDWAMGPNQLVTLKLYKYASGVI